MTVASQTPTTVTATTTITNTATVTSVSVSTANGRMSVSASQVTGNPAPPPPQAGTPMQTQTGGTFTDYSATFIAASASTVVSTLPPTTSTFVDSNGMTRKYFLVSFSLTPSLKRERHWRKFSFSFHLIFIILETTTNTPLTTMVQSEPGYYSYSPVVHVYDLNAVSTMTVSVTG